MWKGRKSWLQLGNIPTHCPQAENQSLNASDRFCLSPVCPSSGLSWAIERAPYLRADCASSSDPSSLSCKPVRDQTQNLIKTVLFSGTNGTNSGSPRYTNGPLTEQLPHTGTLSVLLTRRVSFLQAHCFHYLHFINWPWADSGPDKGTRPGSQALLPGLI